jgi:hypothetical protein
MFFVMASVPIGLIRIGTISRGGLGPKNLHDNRFNKDHRYLAEKTSHHFKNVSISLKMYLKNLAILEKASISLKKSSKIIEIFIKAPYYEIEASITLKMSSKSLVILEKKLILI